MLNKTYISFIYQRKGEKLFSFLLLMIGSILGVVFTASIAFAVYKETLFWAILLIILGFGFFLSNLNYERKAKLIFKLDIDEKTEIIYVQYLWLLKSFRFVKISIPFKEFEMIEKFERVSSITRI
ncbi:MAG: hypothetical protein NTW25_11360 [Candidatus Kapabacteria bacterium]|nr:hypothetical protein [Candidatus Kapabacteria bacterium]